MTENQATQRLAEILGRIAKLPTMDLEPPQFFANYLQLAIAATGSQAGAIWVNQAEQGPQIYCHVDMEKSQINEPEQQKMMFEAVAQTVKNEKIGIYPAQGIEIPGLDTNGRNRCPATMFFFPLKAAGKVAMVLQVLVDSRLAIEDYKGVAGLLSQIADAAETYLAHRRAVVLDDDRKSLARLLKYTESIHNTLDAERVVYQMANMGRDAIVCDRVAVWVNPKVKRGLRAVSGIDKPDHRAVLMQSIEKLCEHSLDIKKPIIASREQLVELPEDEKLTQLLKDYFNVSKLDQIFIQPMRIDEINLGAMVAEGFDESTSANLAGIVSAVASHGARALKNALEMSNMPVIRPLAKLKKVKEDPKKRRKWTIGLIVTFVLLVALAFIPWTIRIECACELTPETMRSVESAVDNVKIVEILIPSGPVKEGDIIAQLDDIDLKTELYATNQQLKQKVINYDRSSDAERSYVKLEIDSLKNQADYLEYQIEKCKVRAPIDGVILTAQLELKEGMTVKKGDPICEVGNLDKWLLRLDVPEAEIDWIKQGLDNSDSSLIQFFLNAYPQYKLKASLKDMSQVSQVTRMKEEGSVFEIRVEMTGDELGEIDHGLRRVGMIGRAKVDTVDKPLGFVLLRKVIRFFNVAFF